MQNRFLAACSAAACLFLLASGLSGAPAQPNRQIQGNQPSVNVLAKPDLAIRGVAITGGASLPLGRNASLSELKKGQTYTLICRYANVGAALKGFWKLGFVIDGQMIMNQYWGEVPAGAEQTKSHVGFVPSASGRHTYECRLDYDKEIAERDENNNQTKMTFEVLP